MSEYKNISNFGTPDYAEEPRYERKNGQWVDTKADIITELEKIKAEIGDMYDNFEKDNLYFAEGLEMAYSIIDKHISELKGENNETDKTDN